jgi:hypothetical protein
MKNVINALVLTAVICMTTVLNPAAPPVLAASVTIINPNPFPVIVAIDAKFHGDRYLVPANTTHVHPVRDGYYFELDGRVCTANADHGLACTGPVIPSTGCIIPGKFGYPPYCLYRVTEDTKWEVQKDREGSYHFQRK